jgi:hypothetical protein
MLFDRPEEEGEKSGYCLEICRPHLLANATGQIVGKEEAPDARVESEDTKDAL